MCTPPLHRLPIIPSLLHHLYILTSSLGPLDPSVKLCLTFGFFAMLRQSNLAPPSAITFEPTRHTYRDDIFTAPPSLLIPVRWIKTHQSIGKALVLPIPGVPSHPAEPVAAYHQLFTSSPTTSSDQPLLTYNTQCCSTTVTVSMLSRALSVLLDALGLDPVLFSFHSLWRGGPQQPTGRAWTTSTSSVSDRGIATHFGTM